MAPFSSSSSTLVDKVSEGKPKSLLFRRELGGDDERERECVMGGDELPLDELAGEMSVILAGLLGGCSVCCF